MNHKWATGLNKEFLSPKTCHCPAIRSRWYIKGKHFSNIALSTVKLSSNVYGVKSPEKSQQNFVKNMAENYLNSEPKALKIIIIIKLHYGYKNRNNLVWNIGMA